MRSHHVAGPDPTLNRSFSFDAGRPEPAGLSCLERPLRGLVLCPGGANNGRSFLGWIIGDRERLSHAHLRYKNDTAYGCSHNQAGDSDVLASRQYSPSVIGNERDGIDFDPAKVLLRVGRATVTGCAGGDHIIMASRVVVLAPMRVFQRVGLKSFLSRDHRKVSGHRIPRKKPRRRSLSLCSRRPCPHERQSLQRDLQGYLSYALLHGRQSSRTILAKTHATCAGSRFPAVDHATN